MLDLRGKILMLAFLLCRVLPVTEKLPFLMNLHLSQPPVQNIRMDTTGS